MKKKPEISIIDYGVGNLRSLARAFEHFGANISITEDAQSVTESGSIVLPGDGAFAAGLEGLKVRKLTKAVLDLANHGKPLLGICLGAQLLMSEGFEFGKHKGLNLIPGKVVKFDKNIEGKIPQIGWNSIYPTKSNGWKGTILSGINPGSNVYFIHSYITVPTASSYVLAKTKYGKSEFCSVIYKDRIFGCQFHPEKSGRVGLAIIKNFIDSTTK